MSVPTSVRHEGNSRECVRMSLGFEASRVRDRQFRVLEAVNHHDLSAASSSLSNFSLCVLALYFDGHLYRMGFPRVGVNVGVSANGRPELSRIPLKDPLSLQLTPASCARQDQEAEIHQQRGRRRLKEARVYCFGV